METKNIRRIVSRIAFSTASVFLLLFFAYGPPARSYENGNRTDGVHSRLPASFPNDAFAHVETIVGFGLRPAASDGETRTSRYVLNEFRDMGLPAVTEEFEFGTFEIENIQLRVGDYRCRPVALGFNPYDEIRFYSGTALVVNPSVEDSPRKGRNILGGYLITTRMANHFRLLAQRPKLIIYVSELDLEYLESLEDLEFELTVEGAEVRRRSSNVVAVVGPHDASPEILLTAHLDSYRDSPGADDDASGLGVLVELARYFKSMEDDLKLRIRFAVLGAEELGLVGARAYTARHAQQLQNCILSLDIDQVGGPKGPNVAVLGGISGLPVQEGRIPFPSGLEERALEGVTSNWRLVDERILPLLAACNHPEWLKELVQQSADELNMVFNPTNNLGGNEYAFTMAGVVATAISTSGNTTHSPGDVPEQVRRESLQKAGSLIALMVLKLAKSDMKRGSSFHADTVGSSHGHSETKISHIVKAIATSNDPGRRRSAILDKMTQAGIRYDLQQFESTARTGTNIVVAPIDSSLCSLLLVAHYDCHAEGLGAVDNAAGVAAVISLAESFSRQPLSNFAVQVLFSDLEEAHMLGAKFFIEANHQHPQLVLNFDTFGYGNVLWLSGKAGDTILSKCLETAALSHGIVLTWEDGTPPGDDQVFRDAGIESIGFGLVRNEELMPIRRMLNGEQILPKPQLAEIIHSDDDVPERVVAADIVRAITVVECALRCLDERSAKRP